MIRRVAMTGLTALYVLWCCVQMALADDACTRALAAGFSTDDTMGVVTQPSDLVHFQRLFSLALERGYFSGEALTRFYHELQSGQVTSPMDEKQSRTDVAKLTFYRAFEQLMARQDISLAQLLPWIERQLQLKQSDEQGRQETKASTHSTFRQMSFARVTKGSFESKFTYEGMATRVVIDRDFGFQVSAVTQWQWAFVVAHSPVLREKLRLSYSLNDRTRDLDALNPAFFKTGSDSREIEIAGQTVRLQADRPIERVNSDDIEAYIDQLNEWSQEDNPLIYQLIVGHTSGSTYAVPSDEQWQYVYTGRGRFQGEFPWGDDPKEGFNYAWSLDISQSRTHEVCQLQPFLFDGLAIFDLLGNVGELTMTTLRSGGYFVRGGCWQNFMTFLRFPARGDFKPIVRSSDSGFRLVRVLPII